METRQLGQGGPDIPVIGLGAWPLGGGMGHVGEQNAIKTIQVAIDNGMTLIDTAQAYRTSETTVGKALKNGYRDRAFIATKVSFDYSPAAIRAAGEYSNRFLDTQTTTMSVEMAKIRQWQIEYAPHVHANLF